MNHPALVDLYRIIPTWRHEALDTWVKTWVDVAYATSTSLHPQEHAAIITVESKRTKQEAANMAVEKACRTSVDFADKTPGREVIVTSSAAFLLPEPKA